MPRKMTFPQGDVHLIGVLFDQLQGKKGALERMGGSNRWLIVEPAGGTPDVRIELNAGDGDENAMNLVLNVTGPEPGKAAYPDLAERGVTTPSGWILMADVGWVLGWRMPLQTTLDEVMNFSFRATKALTGEPGDGMWQAQIVKRPPRPGFTNPGRQKAL